jgi:hypothetical protein
MTMSSGEGAQGGYDDPFEGVEVAEVAGTERHRNVDRAAGRRWPATFREMPGAGREAAVLVHGEGQDVGLVPEDGLGPVAVVDVPVDHRDPPHAQGGTGVRDRDRHVVEHAEPHAGVGRGVVPAWVDERVAVVHPSSDDRFDQFDRTAGGERSDLVTALAEGGDAVAGVTALGEGALTPQSADVFGGVDPQYLFLCGVSCLDAFQVVDQAGHGDEFVQPPFGVGVCHMVADRLEPGGRIGGEQPAAAAVGPAEQLVPHVSRAQVNPPRAGGSRTWPARSRGAGTGPVTP